MAPFHGGKSLQFLLIIWNGAGKQSEVATGEIFTHHHHAVDAAVGIAVGGVGDVGQGCKGHGSHEEEA